MDNPHPYLHLIILSAWGPFYQQRSTEILARMSNRVWLPIHIQISKAI